MNDAPLVEQITELMMVHNKSDPKAGVQVVSEIDKDGKVKTVPADEKNENSFLKFDKNSSILENFIKNFWSQFTTYPFPPAPHDLPRLQGEQAGDQGPGGREKDRRSEGVPQTLRNPSERKQEGTKCKPKKKKQLWQTKRHNRRNPCNRARYSRRHSNSSSPRLNRQRRSHKDRITGIMRTWSTGRSWKRSESQRLRWNSRDSLIPC
ncbi:hypothetical protein NXY07_09725 [Phocaeicola dorei]|nr:hypothetical protein [Phocaeicola dorei]